MPRYRIRYDRKADDDIKSLTSLHFPNSLRLSRAIDAVEGMLADRPEILGWPLTKARAASQPIRVVQSDILWFLFRVDPRVRLVTIHRIFDRLPKGTPPPAGP